MEKIYKGNIEITKSNQEEMEKLLSDYDGISGYLYIYSQATLKADNLKSVGGDLSIYSQATLNNLKSVGGYLYIHSQATLKADNLKSVGGYLYIHSQISLKLQKQLWGHNKKNKYYVCEFISDWLLKRLATKSNTEYRINNVNFKYDLFCKVRKDKLTAEEVFAIENTEQRRIAYQKMDKLKMKELKDYKVESEVKDDGYGFPMKVISFEIKGFDSPFYFLNCFCPSTGREYFIETRETDCWEAKQKSFGLDVKFDEEF